ncbi:MAG: hypothetical protein Q4B60_05030 [Erysipelotrichaceae bacterium]|nr:hypothetical protein [Erysipelotrichaceae bacterium]
MKKYIVLLLIISLLISGCSKKTEESIPDKDTQNQPVENTNTADVSKENKYLNFDDMHFYFNGHKIELGKTTLEELLNYGAEICDTGYILSRDEWPDINEDLKADYVQGVHILINEGYYLNIGIYNPDEEDKPLKDCAIYDASLNTNEGENQSVITFNFPYSLSIDELKEECGEPDEEYGQTEDYHIIYRQWSKTNEYYQSYYYFVYRDGVLASFAMNYMD